MKQVSRFFLTVTSLALTLCLVSPFEVGAEMIKKVDNFVVFMDQSGSMTSRYGRPVDIKFEQAVDAVNRLDQAVPEFLSRAFMIKD